MSLVRREIAEQPAVLERLLEANREAVATLAAALAERPPAYAVLAARGSSDNAARYAQHLLGRLNGWPVALATPSLHTLYGRPPRYREALLVGISQSGESPDVVAVLEEGRRQGRPTVAITNRPDARLARAAEHVLLLHAGAERAVASTKTYTASLAAVAQLAAAVSGDVSLAAELDSVPALVERQLELAGGGGPIVREVATWRRCAVVGRGANYATAFEAALKLKELTGIAAEPYSPADLLHGPIALLGPDYPALVVAPAGASDATMGELLAAAGARAAPLLLVTNDAALAATGALRVPLVDVPEWLSPIVAVLPAQALAVGVAELRGVDVDSPFGLSKVTLTT